MSFKDFLLTRVPEAGDDLADLMELIVAERQDSPRAASDIDRLPLR